MGKRKIILVLCSIVLLLSMIGASAGVPDRTAGVHTGDTFIYGNVSVEWYSNNPSVPLPPELKDWNETEWALASVENVVGTNVTISLLSHFKNGTERIIQSGWIDVDTGNTNNANISAYCISANLTMGDPIYSDPFYNNTSWKITETIPKAYGGGVPRDINHLNRTSLPSPSLNWSQNFYWDQATGALFEMSMTINQTYEDTIFGYSISMELTEFNLVPEFVGLPQILLLLASLTLATLAIRRRLRKTQNS